MPKTATPRRRFRTDGYWLRLRTRIHPELGDGLEAGEFQFLEKDVALALCGNMESWPVIRTRILTGLRSGKITFKAAVNLMVSMLGPVEPEPILDIKGWFEKFLLRWLKVEAKAAEARAKQEANIAASFLAAIPARLCPHYVDFQNAWR